MPPLTPAAGTGTTTNGTTSSGITGTPAPPTGGRTVPASTGFSFVDQLVAADRGGDGLSAAEISAASAKLSKLAGTDQAEKSLLAALIKAKKSVRSGVAVQLQWDDAAGKLRLTLPSGEETLSVRAEGSSLPSTLIAGSGLEVDQGTDPGNFYCEHMFWSTQVKATEPGSSVLENAAGEKLCGFLHVPSDNWTSLDPNSAEAKAVTQAERHRSTRRVIAAAIRGYADAIAAQFSGAIKILITGYDAFDSIKNNPTGDFVSHRENLDAAMKLAFGDRLASAEGELRPGSSKSLAQTYRFNLRPAGQDPARVIDVSLAKFPVSDSAITPKGRGSVQTLMQSLLPQAVLSMGVAPGDAYRAEFRADSGGLARTTNQAHHDDSAPDTARLADNFALARALLDGKSVVA